MKKTTNALAALAIVLLAGSAAHATNFCATFGIADVVASGLSIPGKGTCKAFNGFISNEGLLLAGDICTSSDGTTVLFNVFTQVGAEPDSIAGTFGPSTGTGTGNECVGANSGCDSFSVTVTKCPKKVTLPAVTSSQPQSQSDFVTQ